MLGRALTGGNPITTWYMLKALLSDDSGKARINTSTTLVKSKDKGFQPLHEFHCQFDVIQRLRKDFFNRCNLNWIITFFHLSQLLKNILFGSLSLSIIIVISISHYSPFFCATTCTYHLSITSTLLCVIARVNYIYLLNVNCHL